MKHYTSIEQSKKLLELGLSPESADCHYNSQALDNDGNHPMLYGVCSFEYDIPCWSVGALLELMPANIKAKESTEPYSLMVFKDKVESNGDDYYRVEYGYRNPMTVGWLNAWYETKGGIDLMESVFLMVCWLLENGYIGKGE